MTAGDAKMLIEEI